MILVSFFFASHSYSNDNLSKIIDAFYPEYKLLRFKFSGNTLEMKCVSPDVGESKTVIPIEYSGEELEVGLNPEFLLDFLKNVDSDRVQLELKDQGTAGVFKVEGGCVYVVMPMNLGD